MNMKTTRNHYSGYSNIDYRTKKDKAALSLFQPWKIAQSFGMLGQSHYRTPSPELKKFWDISANISSDKNIIAQSPDPKIYKSILFYKQNKMSLRTKSFILSERVAQLDESSKGKEPFTGDSLLYSDSVKKRKEMTRNVQLLKSKKESINQHQSGDKITFKPISSENLNKTINRDRNRNRDKESISIDEKKEMKSQTVDQYTNLPIKTLQNTIDSHRLIEIRNKIRQRYMNKNCVVKAYRYWNEANKKEITVHDAHSAINRLGIPIDYNETRALLIASNARQTDSLNIEEFIDLVFSESNQIIKGDLSKAVHYDKSQLNSLDVLESFKTISTAKEANTVRPNDILYIESAIKHRIPKVLSIIEKEGCTEQCSLSTLEKIFKKMDMPERYIKHNVLKALCNKFPIKDSNSINSQSNNNNNNSAINIKELIQYCLNKKDPSFFFDLKATSLSLLKNSISERQYNNSEEIKHLKHSMTERAMIRNEFIKAIEEKKKRKTDEKAKEKAKANEINNCQPSIEFLIKVHKDSQLCRDKMKENKDRISSLPKIYKLQGKTRSGANPPYKDTYKSFQPEPNSAMYISEKDRFKIKDSEIIDFIITNKETSLLKRNFSYRRIGRLSSEFEQKQHNKDLLLQYRNKRNIIKKSGRLFAYEYTNQLQNLN